MKIWKINQVVERTEHRITDDQEEGAHPRQFCGNVVLERKVGRYQWPAMQTGSALPKLTLINSQINYHLNSYFTPECAPAMCTLLV